MLSCAHGLTWCLRLSTRRMNVCGTHAEIGVVAQGASRRGWRLAGPGDTALTLVFARPRVLSVCIPLWAAQCLYVRIMF